MTKQPEFKNIASFFLLFNARNSAVQSCFDFTTELEKSLSLIGIGFLAQYFSQIAGLTAALLAFLFFTKAFSKPKALLSLISLPVTYFIVFQLSNYFVKNIFSYCLY